MTKKKEELSIEGLKQTPFDQLPKEDQKNLTEFKEEQRIKGIGDMIDFSILYAIKGRGLIWTSKNGHVNKSGMILMTEILNPSNKALVKRDDLVCLGHYYFATTETEVFNGTERIKHLHINQVFNNLNAHFIDVDVNSDTYKDELMSVMCPNFDPAEFKPYHMEKVVKWYNEIKNKIIAVEVAAKLKNL